MDGPPEGYGTCGVLTTSPHTIHTYYIPSISPHTTGPTACGGYDMVECMERVESTHTVVPHILWVSVGWPTQRIWGHVGTHYISSYTCTQYHYTFSTHPLGIRRMAHTEDMGTCGVLRARTIHTIHTDTTVLTTIHRRAPHGPTQRIWDAVVSSIHTIHIPYHMLSLSTGGPRDGPPEG
jgi:hypothetical protein